MKKRLYNRKSYVGKQFPPLINVRAFRLLSNRVEAKRNRHDKALLNDNDVYKAS